ncbi:MAG: DNA methyltransferase [Methylococcaceae bacterium]
MKNQIYYGDNLDVLRNNIEKESVDLCYIDPPFNSNRDYSQIYLNVGKEKENAAQAQAFIDTWTWNDSAIQGLAEIKANVGGALTTQSIDLIKGLEIVLGKDSLFAYLVSMTLRIAQIHRVLKPTGSFYLHCDPTASHYLKLVCDAAFCSRGGAFVNEIIWKRTNVHSHAAQGTTHFSRVNDVILFYSKSNQRIWRQIYTPHSEQHIANSYKYIEEETGRKYALSDLTATNGKAKGNPTFEFLGVTRYWRYNEEKMERMLAEGLIVQKNTGTVPRFKRYLDESSGTEVSSLWADISPLSAKSKEKLGYPTQKPEALLERIINASSNEGDVVLDAYCGCGTTVAVAHRLKRTWIGIDITYQSISLILKRLEDTFTSDFNESVLDKDSAKTFEKIEVNGVPRDMASAIALANKSDDKTRKEFEKWMVLAYSKNRAMINDKKGGDKGIDGIAYIADRIENGAVETEKVIFSVKSNKNVTQAMLRELLGTVEREKAACGFLLMLYPAPALVKESKQLGEYTNAFTGNNYQKIKVVCVEDLLNGEVMNLPNPVEVTKKAVQNEGKQGEVF